MSNEVYNLLGIGFGPSNISLAILLQKHPSISYHFIDAGAPSKWRKGLMLGECSVNPSNNVTVDLMNNTIEQYKCYSLDNYPFETDKIFQYMNLEKEGLYSKSYLKYMSQRIKRFPNKVEYNIRALKVRFRQNEGGFIWEVICNNGQVYLAKNLILGTGPSPYIPKLFEPHQGLRVFHYTKYVDNIKRYDDSDKLKIAMIGADENSVRITLDLLKKFPNARVVNFITDFKNKSLGLGKPNLWQDQSHFSFQDNKVCLDYFLDKKKKEIERRKLTSLERKNFLASFSQGDQKGYYCTNSLNQKILDKLNKIEEAAQPLHSTVSKQEFKNPRIQVKSQTIIESVSRQQATVKLTYKDLQKNICSSNNFNVVILATGFKSLGSGEGQEPYPEILKDVVDQYEFIPGKNCINLQDGCFLLPKPPNFSLPMIFLNGLYMPYLDNPWSFTAIKKRSDMIVKAIIAKKNIKQGDMAM